MNEMTRPLTIYDGLVKNSYYASGSVLWTTDECNRSKHVFKANKRRIRKRNLSDVSIVAGVILRFLQR